MNKPNLAALLCALVAFINVNVIFAQPTLKFSHERGFYHSSFKLVIQSHPSEGIIRYTLDGSDPRNNKNAFTATSPAQLTINPYLTQGRASTAGVIVRACTIAGKDTSKTSTHSYLFLSEVKYQKNVSAELLPYWPDQTSVPSTFSPNLVDWMQNMSHFQVIRLNIDPNVVYPEEALSEFEQDLLSIPTLSLVTAPSNLFDDSTGIYINGTWTGIAWEREASLELIDPYNEGFQVNTGIRIRGGWSSTGSNPKHAFRLYFRDEYGDSKLKYPLFGNDGFDEFDKIDLRCEQNNSWNAGSGTADYIHESFSRKLQGDMNQPFTRSRYYHLYLNGMYWGLYQTQERASADFGSSYLGGEKEDYDVIKSSAGSIDYPPYTLEATDGDLNATKALWDIAMEGFNHDNYYRAMGLNPDGTKNPSYPKYLDVDNLISYMMIIYYSANRDGPASLSENDTRINNFFGIYNRKNPDGFKFCIHDNETAYTQVNDNVAAAPFVAGWTFESFNPLWLHHRLLENPDYKQRFADLSYRYLAGKGVLSPEHTLTRFKEQVEMIDEAIVGESARWGDRVFSKERSWTTSINRMMQTFLPQRSQIVIDQFKALGWLSNLTPPTIDSSEIVTGENMLLSKSGSLSLYNKNTSGTIYYTTDGKDPRNSGGSISTEATAYTGPLTVDETLFIEARVKDGEQWSPLFELVIMKEEGKGLLISEINYHPIQQVVDGDTLKSDDLEFIEIKNNTHSTIDLSGYTLSNGVRYTFPQQSEIEANQLLVIASDSSSFRKLYGFSSVGQYRGNLKNDSERILLKNPCGLIISDITYNNSGIWQKATDGAGYTLVITSLQVNQLQDDWGYWRTSTNWLGSPGKDDPSYTIAAVGFNEVLANSPKPKVDFIELRNTGKTAIDISGWYLSDDKEHPAKWRIPLGTTIQSGGTVVFYEGHYASDSMLFSGNEFGSSFSLSKGGESLYLYSAGSGENPGNFVADFLMEATDENVSFGNYTNRSGTELHVQLKDQSPNSPNGVALLSPLIFKTIMYHPVDGNYEFLILKNRSDSTLHLYERSDERITWRIKGIDFEFPSKVSIKSGDSLFVVEKSIDNESFRATMKLPVSAQIFSYSGKLSNGGETIAIQKPLLVVNDTVIETSYITLEAIAYGDRKPWPKYADGEGHALYRIDEEVFGNDAVNWTSIMSTLPVAIAGSNKRVRLNTTVSLDGSGSYDPLQMALGYDWKIETKPTGSAAQLSNGKTAQPHFTCDKEGNYLLSLKVSNGKNQSTAAYVSIFAIPNTAPVTDNFTRTYKINLNQSLSLGAFECIDADYDSLNYLWTLLEKPEGSGYTFDDFTGKSFSFKADMIGNYRFNLTCNDGELSGKTISIKVVVSPSTEEVALSDKQSVKVYPNPILNGAYASFNLIRETETIVVVTAITGQVIAKANLGLLEHGNHVIPIDFTSQKSGIYVVTVKTKDFISNIKVHYMPEH